MWGFVFAFLVLLATAEDASKGKLVEWELNLFEAANYQKNTQCEPVDLLAPPGHYAGYFYIDGTQDGHLHYFYFENRLKDPDAPLVLWTNGGPGCSSYLGLFTENGPYELQEDLSLCWREFGWDVGHNIIFVEHPFGVGFSYSTSSKDKVTDEDDVGGDILEFLHAFMKAHPEMKDKDLYLTGESYGGHYVPAMARAVIDGNKHPRNPHLNFKGILLVDPYVDPVTLYESYPVYAYQENLISEEKRDRMLQNAGTCTDGLETCDSLKIPFLESFLCPGAVTYCEITLFEPIILANPGLNYYDIRLRDCRGTSCTEDPVLTAFLNQREVKAALNITKPIKWEECDYGIHMDLMWDMGTDMEDTVADILNAGYEVTVMVGNKDLICNRIGNEAWLDKMKWDHSSKWRLVEKKAYKAPNGLTGGYVRQMEQLSFVVVPEAGHMIPMNQPEISLELLTAFTNGEPYPTEEPTPTFPTT